MSIYCRSFTLGRLFYHSYLEKEINNINLFNSTINIDCTVVCNDDGAQNCHRRHSRATMLAAPTQLYYIPAQSSPPPPTLSPRRRVVQLGQVVKTHQKLDSKNSWNWLIIFTPATVLTNFEYEWPETEVMWICQSLLGIACNSLTNFEYELNAMAGNGNDVNLLKLSHRKKSWNHIKWIHFWRISGIWDQSGSPCPECPARITIAMKGEIRFQEINGSSPCSRKLISSLI